MSSWAYKIEERFSICQSGRRSSSLHSLSHDQLIERLDPIFFKMIIDPRKVLLTVTDWDISPILRSNRNILIAGDVNNVYDVVLKLYGSDVLNLYWSVAQSRYMEPIIYSELDE